MDLGVPLRWECLERGARGFDSGWAGAGGEEKAKMGIDEGGGGRPRRTGQPSDRGWRRQHDWPETKRH